MELLKITENPEQMESFAQQAKKASELLKALSHEHRLMILCILQEGERTVSELEQMMSMSQAGVSQQLARLRFDRLVSTRREGRQIYYSIADGEIGELISQLHAMFCSPK